MKETTYAYAVSSVRAMENTLLTKAFTDSLITVGYDEAKRLLCDKGLTAFEKTDDVSTALSGYMDNAYSFLCDIAPDPHELDFLVITNDFHNLKAALKSVVSGASPDGSFITPCLADAHQVCEKVTRKQFDLLPAFLRKTAEEGYELLTSTLDGQLLDVFVDSAALSCILLTARKSESKAVNDYAEHLCALSDIKIALRASRGVKAASFFDTAFADTQLLDIQALKRAASKSEDDVLHVLDVSGFSSLAQTYRESVAAFERECDNILLEIFSGAHMVSFGIEPLVAFYLAKSAEQKTLRIIMSCKHSGLSNEIIAERVREFYV